MKCTKYKIGDRVIVGDKSKGRERVMYVYEVTKTDGSKYLALHSEIEYRNGIPCIDEYQGALSFYEPLGIRSA